MRAYAGVVVLAIAMAACGDPETGDRRGYTKAPLERPGLIVTGEEASEMSTLGTPDRPRIIDEPTAEPTAEPPVQPAEDPPTDG